MIALERIGRVDLLGQVCGLVLIPLAVEQEWKAVPLPPWLQVKPVQDLAVVKSLTAFLGPGESEAIALALEAAPDQLVLDDRKARKAAAQFGLPLSGTVAIVLLGKEQGVLTHARPVLDDLRATGFWISPKLYQSALQRAGE